MSDTQLQDLEINSEDQIDIIENHLNYSYNPIGLPTKTKRGRAPKAKNFQSICGCGNVYSCSSALSLHIKNKHGGQAPQGSVGFPTMTYRRKEGKKNIETSSHTDYSQPNESIHSSKRIPSDTKGCETTQMLQKQSHQTLNQTNEESNQGQDMNQINDYLNQEAKNNPDQADNPHNSLEKKCVRRKYKTNRQYISKRIYLCGCLSLGFGFLQELLLHIKQKHGDQIPDGSIFGLKREGLLSIFHIANPRPSPIRKYYIFRCGCGKEYSCSSSLYYHIKTVHGGSEPLGTFVTTKE